MDCGVPFCHEACPLGNKIPDWNDLVYRDHWRDALTQLHATNDFPEFTGLICPAPCESACVLNINDDAVTIEQIELAIVTRGFEEGWIVPHPPERRTERTVAVVGSGPAGLAAASQLNRLGHEVTVYERDEAPGGLLRFGVPDAKLEKWIIDRRLALLERGGRELRVRRGRGTRPDRAASCGGATTRSWWPPARACRARSSVPGAGAGGRAPRDGLPVRPQPLGRPRRRAARARLTGERDLRGRQARRGGWRRRHRHGLRLERPARGRGRRAAARRLPRASRVRARCPARRGRCRPSAP